MITTDQNLKYQQHLVARSIAIIVLLSTSWPRIKSKADQIESAVNSVAKGDYLEVSI